MQKRIFDLEIPHPLSMAVHHFLQLLYFWDMLVMVRFILSLKFILFSKKGYSTFYTVYKSRLKKQVKIVLTKAEH